MNSGQQRVSLPAHDVELRPWKQAIGQGNQAFISGDVQFACAQYELALANVKCVLDRSLNNMGMAGRFGYLDNVMAALVVTHHNIADLYSRANDVDQVIEHLCEAHTAMFVLLHHPAKEISAMAQRHMRLTHDELQRFSNKYGAHVKVEQTFMMTKFICACCVRKILH